MIHISPKKPDIVDVKSLPDYEAIQINIELVEINKDPMNSKSFFQPGIGLKLNFYSCVGTSKKGEMKVVR